MKSFLNPPTTRALALFSLAIILFLPTWLWLGEAWWSDPYYSHGPLVVLVSLYFFWARRHVIASGAKQHSHRTAFGAVPVSPGPNAAIASSQTTLLAMTWNNLGLLLIAAALAVHLWATWWHAFYISALMIPIVLLGLFLMLHGWQIAKSFIFPLAFLILMVPLPLAERFGPVLERWTATGATAIARFMGVAATNDGSQVFLPNSTFTVGIPCGGLRSAIAIITLATLFAYIVQGPRWARAAIFLAAVPIALAANTFRISLLFAIAQQWGEQVGMDYFHSWSSPVLFFSAFALLLGLAYLLRCARVRWEVILPA